MNAELVAKMVDAVIDAVDKPLSALAIRVKSMEARLAAIEQRPVAKYAGTWKSDAVYQVGDMVTHAGSVWHANAETSDMPGNGSSAWQLAVKRGRDGRDARATP